MKKDLMEMQELVSVMLQRKSQNEKIFNLEEELDDFVQFTKENSEEFTKTTILLEKLNPDFLAPRLARFMFLDAEHRLNQLRFEYIDKKVKVEVLVDSYYAEYQSAIEDFSSLETAKKIRANFPKLEYTIVSKFDQEYKERILDELWEEVKKHEPKYLL